MVVYLFHGFVIKTFKALGWPDFTASYPIAGLVLTMLGAVGLTLLLAAPPVRRVLEPFTNPLGWLEARRDARRRKRSSSDDSASSAPTSA
jgi:fucose 4-O-acetylase-like acetyltransferase